jgi:hypothetical protein
MNWNDVIGKLKELFDAFNGIQAEYSAFWSANILLTWRWWLKVAALTLPWAVWIFARKKESVARLLLAGLFVAVLSVYLDEIGTDLGLWYYTAKIAPFLPGNTVYNLSVLPVAAMLFIQFFPRVKPAYKALVFAAVGAFVALPLLSGIGYYCNVKWTYWYSFPILFAEYWLAHRLALSKSFDPIA